MAAVTRFLQSASARGPFIPFLKYIYFDFKSASKNNSTEAARTVIKYHAAFGPLGKDTLIQLKGFFLFSNSLHPEPPGVVFLTSCCADDHMHASSPHWDEHAHTLMYIIPIYCAHDTYFTLGICIYIFILPVSPHRAVTLPVNICIVMTFMSMRAARLRQPLMLQW